eukprot:2946214-Pyramimonas_sp.AAC.1
MPPKIAVDALPPPCLAMKSSSRARGHGGEIHRQGVQAQGLDPGAESHHRELRVRMQRPGQVRRLRSGRDLPPALPACRNLDADAQVREAEPRRGGSPR